MTAALLPTFFWLGKDGQPEMEWRRHNGPTIELRPDGARVWGYREWLKYPKDPEECSDA